MPLNQAFGDYEMCGIAGYTHSSRAIDGSLIRRITAALGHRGPDQDGVYESACVSLGAVRLKIIDLDDGDQPMASAAGDTVIVFNGEIYNHAELRRELEQRGHRFRTRCDTEVALHAFLEWDTECFARLRGMFAIAIWSERTKRLVLARDRLGIKPLYIAHRRSEIYFGSEMKAILEHPEIARTLNLGALDDYLSLNYAPGRETLIEGIEKLTPGHWLEWHNGQIRTEAFWALDFHPRQWTLGAAKEQLDALLRQAVREHLVSDVPLGIWASGGLDSSTILHYASLVNAGAHHGRLKTFSVSFSGRCCDESRYFREVAAAYGTEHHEFDLSPNVELQDAIEDFAWYSDEPSADAGALPVWFLSRMSRQHVTVTLSGDGADELFGGYLTYMADRWASSLRCVPGGVRRLMLGALDRYCPVSDKKLSFEYKLKRWIQGSFLAPDEAHFFWNGTFSRAQKRELLTCAVDTASRGFLQRLAAPANGTGGVNRYLLLDQYSYLPADILHKVDRMSMAHSLEVRPPFLDHRIVEFAASLPEDFKIRGVTQKFLLKELMRGKLPASILHRKKSGFDIPAHEWFRGFLRPMLYEALSPEAIENTGIFRPGVIERLIRDHMERRVNVGYHLWGLLTLFIWMKRWRVEAPLPREAGRDMDSRALVIN